MPPVCLQLLQPATPHHSEAVVVNPDASRSFVVRDGGWHAPHGSCVRGGFSDNAGRLLSEISGVPFVHRCRRNKSGHDRSNCRQTLDPGNPRTKRTVLLRCLPRAIPDVDAEANKWNNPRACVLRTMWGHGTDIRLGS